MRRIFLFIGFFAALLMTGFMLLLAGARTDAGRRWIADEVAKLSGGTIAIAGLDGAVPTNFTIDRLVLSDQQGAYLEARGLSITTSPLRLLSGVLRIDRLTTHEVRASRAPAGDETQGQNESALPVRIELAALAIDLLDMSAALTGLDAQLRVTGSGRMDDLRHMQIVLDVARIDAPGNYHLDGRIDARSLIFHASAQEPAGGLLAHLAGIDSIGPIELSAFSEGPRDAQKFSLALKAGPAQLQAKGNVDLDHRKIVFDATGSARESHPRSDLAWRALQLDAHVHGDFDAPEAEGHVGVDGIDAADLSITSAQIQFGGNQGRVALTGNINGLRFPNPPGDLLAAAPIMIRAEAMLNASDRPVIVEFEHPLAKAVIKAKTAPDIVADIDLSVPRLGPLVQRIGLALDGAAKLVAHVAQQRGGVTVESQGTLDLSGGALARWLGKPAHFEIAASRAGDLIRLDRAMVEGRALRLDASARLAGKDLSADWNLDLRDLAALAPELTGSLHATGQMRGPLDHLKLIGDLTGTVTAREMSSGPLKASLRLDDLPNAPSGRIEASGELLAAPLRIAVNANKTKTGFQVAIETAEWKSARAKGAIDLPKGAQFPTGQFEATMDNLGDLAPLLDETIAGRLNARIETERRQIHLRAEGDEIAMPAVRVHKLDLDARIVDPENRQTLNGKLRLSGIKGSHLADGSALVEAEGSLDALRFRLQSTFATDRGTIKLAGSGTGSVQHGTLDSMLSLDFGATHAAELKVSGAVPSKPDAPIDFACTGDLDLAALDPILTPNGREARGRLALALRVTGSSDDPRLGGTVTLDNGSFQDLAIGLRLRDVSAHVEGQGQKLVIRDFTGQGKGGRVRIEGTVGVLESGIPVDLHLTAEPAALLSSDLLTATAGADVKIHGQAVGALALAGRVDVAKADINLPDHLPQQVSTLDVRRPGEAPAPAEPQSAITLDLAIAAPERVFLRGRGIDAELGGTLKLAGTSAKPQMTGGFDLRRGTYSIAGQALKFTRGKITLDVAGPNDKIDPLLDLAAESVTSTITVDLTVTGHADSPKITLTSSPELPQDEILAQLLFKKSTSELSPLQIAEIAEAMASLAGDGGSINPISNIRTGLGLDRLAVGSDSSGGTSVEAGKYVSRGVYVGAKQGSGVSQGQVQIDLTASLQLQTTLGNGGVPTAATTPDNDPGSSIGLSWHFDY